MSQPENRPLTTPWINALAVPLVQAVVGASCGAVLYVASTASKTDATAQQLAAFRVDITAKFAEYQAENKNRFEELSRQVAGLPDQSAALRQLDVRVTRLEASKDTRDKQLSDLAAQVMQDHADLAAIQNANRPKLGLTR